MNLNSIGHRALFSRERGARHGLALGMAVFVGAVLMAGCTSTGGGTTGAHYGGTLTAALAHEPDELDPHVTVDGHAFWVDEEIFDTLVIFDDKQHVQPDLATSWSVSGDQKTYTFTLRNAKWSDGSEFTSADVVYSYEREITGKLSWASKLSSVSSVQADGPRKVVIQLTAPDSSLLIHLGGFKDQAIVEKSNAESGAIKETPIGTGPFKLASWQHGSKITLVRNPYYWGRKAYPEKIVFTFVTDPTVALQDLESGTIQWTNNLPSQSLKSLESAPPKGLVVKSVPSTGYEYFTLNNQHKPLDDVRVRQAIAFAVDRNAISKAAQFGNATLNQTAIPASSPWYYKYEPYSYDPAKAKSLLAAAGVHNLTLQMIASTAYPPAVALAQVITSELADVGITVKIHSIDDATYFAMQGSGQFDIATYAWIFDLDPSDFYYLQQHCGASFNFQHFCDSSVDQLLDQAHNESDFAKRKALYDQAAKLIVDGCGYIYTDNPNYSEGYSTKLNNYSIRGDGMVRFWDTSLT